MIKLLVVLLIPSVSMAWTRPFPDYSDFFSLMAQKLSIETMVKNGVQPRPLFCIRESNQTRVYLGDFDADSVQPQSRRPSPQFFSWLSICVQRLTRQGYDQLGQRYLQAQVGPALAGKLNLKAFWSEITPSIQRQILTARHQRIIGMGIGVANQKILVQLRKHAGLSVKEALIIMNVKLMAQKEVWVD